MTDAGRELSVGRDPPTLKQSGADGCAGTQIAKSAAQCGNERLVLEQGSWTNGAVVGSTDRGSKRTEEGCDASCENDSSSTTKRWHGSSHKPSRTASLDPRPESGVPCGQGGEHERRVVRAGVQIGAWRAVPQPITRVLWLGLVRRLPGLRRVAGPSVEFTWLCSDFADATFEFVLIDGRRIVQEALLADLDPTGDALVIRRADPWGEELGIRWDLVGILGRSREF